MKNFKLPHDTTGTRSSTGSLTWPPFLNLDSAPLPPSPMMNTIDSNGLCPEDWDTQLLHEISFEDHHEGQDDGFVDLLSLIMHQKNKPRLKDSYEPIDVSYCEQDYERRICQNHKDFAAATPTKKINTWRNDSIYTTGTGALTFSPFLELDSAPLPPSRMINTIDSTRLCSEDWDAQLVHEISFADHHEDQDEGFVDLLSPSILQHQKNKPHLKECYEPIAVSYCEQDCERRICQNLTNLIATPAKKIDARSKQLPLPTPTKKIKTQTKVLPPTPKKIKTRKKASPVYTRAAQFTFKHNVWMERYEDLVFFLGKHGHCFVDGKTDPLLAQWVKRQRYQSKLKSEGKHTTLTDERMMALESMGFIWEKNRAIWEERWNELCVYHQIHGHANVPSTFPENPQLAMWVKGQRRQYSLNQSGKKSSITKERTFKLDRLGFVWNIHKGTVKQH
jgi:hypothetical protein